MNTLSIIALVVIGLCVGYIGYCIYGAWRISHRSEAAPPHEGPPETPSPEDAQLTEENNNQ